MKAVSLFIAALFLAGGAWADGLSSRQTDILRITMATDGWLSRTMHQEFWDEAPPELRDNKQMQVTFAQLMQDEFLQAEIFQRETWNSAKLSVQAHSVVRTTGYLEAKKKGYSSALLQNNSDAQAGLIKARDNAEAILLAAANRTPMQTARGTFYVTPELVDMVMSGLDAAICRMKRLMHIDWNDDVQEYSYDSLHVSVLARCPFVLQIKDILTAGKQASIMMLTSRTSESDYFAISFIYTGATFLDPAKSVEAIANSGMSSMGIT
ncbi:MAG: hypothetical protein ABR878_11350 [Roseiarcus sp.]|jgi:hypothetical protein